MSTTHSHTASPHNEWRTQTPGHTGWARTAHAADPHKYYMVSVDTHGIEPNDYLEKRIEKKYLDRIPRMEIDEDGAQWTICEGMKPVLVKPGRNMKNTCRRWSRSKISICFSPTQSALRPKMCAATMPAPISNGVWPTRLRMALMPRLFSRIRACWPLARLTRFSRAPCSAPGTAGRLRPLAIIGRASCLWP